MNNEWKDCLEKRINSNFEKFGNSLNCSFFILLHRTSNITIYIYMCINFYDAYSSLGAIG